MRPKSARPSFSTERSGGGLARRSEGPRLPLARRVYSVGLSALRYSGVAEVFLKAQRSQSGALVLCYHGVQEPSSRPFDVDRDKFVTPQAFDRQLRFLRRHFPVVSLGEVVERLERKDPFRPSVVAVTFDDGYRNTATVAYPIIKRHGIPVTLFLATGYIGNARRVWWHEVEALVGRSTARVEFRGGPLSGEYDLCRWEDKWKVLGAVRRVALSSPPAHLEEVLSRLRGSLGAGEDGAGQGEAFLSWEEAKALVADGLVEPGSHGVTHAAATRLPPEILMGELRESKDVIESTLGRKADFFAYPYGRRDDCSAQTARAVERAGYRCALTTENGVVRHGCDPFLLKRIVISGLDSWSTFVCKLAGIDRRLGPAGRWLLGGAGKRAPDVPWSGM